MKKVLTLEWTQLKIEGNSPKRQFHTACTFENIMYIFGGGDGKFWLNDLFKFDLDEKVWSLIEVKGKIPSKNSIVEHNDWRFKIIEVEEKRIIKVEVTKIHNLLNS